MPSLSPRWHRPAYLRVNEVCRDLVRDLRSPAGGPLQPRGVRAGGAGGTRHWTFVRVVTRWPPGSSGSCTPTAVAALRRRPKLPREPDRCGGLGASRLRSARADPRRASRGRARGDLTRHWELCQQDPSYYATLQATLVASHPGCGGQGPAATRASYRRLSGTNDVPS